MTLSRLFATAVASAAIGFTAHAAGGAKHPHSPEGGWAHEGFLGDFDQASVQRGYQTYKAVCASCHSMDLIYFRNLAESTGPYYDPNFSPVDNPLVKAFAEEATVTDGPDDTGEMFTRPGRPSDPFPNPYPNDKAARSANGGALPPDMSVITKARAGGPDYIYSLVEGYPDVPTNHRALAFKDDKIILKDRLLREDAEGWYYETDPEAENPDRVYLEKGEDYDGILVQPAGLYYNAYFPGDTTPNWTGDPRKPPKGGFLAMAPQIVDPIYLDPEFDLSALETDDEIAFHTSEDGDRKTCREYFDSAKERVSEEEEAVVESGGVWDPRATAAVLREDFYSQCIPKVEYLDGTYPSKAQISKDVTNFLHWAAEPKATYRKRAGLAVMGFLAVLAVLLWFSYRRIWRNVEH